MKRQWGIGVGSASVLIIFVLLCLTVFATLSLVSAQADLRLAERAAETTAAWYEVDGRAAEFLCALDQAFEETSSPAELPDARVAEILEGAAVLDDSLGYDGARLLRYQVAVDENRAIEAAVSYTVSESGLSRRIESWRTVQTGGFAVEEPMTLWQGTTAALPNLEG